MGNARSRRRETSGDRDYNGKPTTIRLIASSIAGICRVFSIRREAADQQPLAARKPQHLISEAHAGCSISAVAPSFSYTGGVRTDCTRLAWPNSAFRALYQRPPLRFPRVRGNA